MFEPEECQQRNPDGWEVPEGPAGGAAAESRAGALATGPGWLVGGHGGSDGASVGPGSRLRAKR